MRTEALFAVTLAAVLTAGCGARVPGPSNVAPGTPHVSWVIMSGDRDNADREFVCQSDPRTDCVMPASRPDAQAFADVHVYYHGAGAETKYHGTVAIGFLEGSSAASTAKPGTYAVTFTMTATVADTGKTHPIQQSLPVIVH
jgi:hypothetical protein